MRIALSIFLLLFSFSAWAQSETDSAKGLEMFHREKRMTKVIPLGAKVVLSVNGEKSKGILESVGAEDLTVGGVKYRYRDITWIGVRTKWTKTLGIGLAVVGVGIATAGVIYVAAAGGGGFIGTGLIAAGGLGMTAVSIPLIKEGKRHYLDSDWKVVPPGE